MVILGVDGRVLFTVAILATVIGHLNHSNLNLSWGPLRHVFNSSRMHIWHHMHDFPADHARGLNFGVSLSVWDWLFGTAYWPSKNESPQQQPEALGFPGMERMPRSLIGRFFAPVLAFWRALTRSS